MPIPFTCPHCGAQTTVSEEYAGQSGPCASCGKTITVPSFEGTSLAAAQRARPSAGPVIALIAVIALFGILICGGIFSLMVVRIAGVRPPLPVAAPAGAQCTNRLKQIGLAMHNYHDSYRHFPTAVVTDENDRPMHSWRVAILPFMDQASLYDMYDFDEPWDGPNNSVLLESSPDESYRCPDDFASGPYDTSYMMVVGEGTLGGKPNEEVSIAGIVDGTSYTILVIEVAGAAVSWCEPRDITVEEAVTFVTNPQASPFEQVHPGGVHVLMADGSVHFLPNSIDPQILRSMLTKADGQVVPVDF